MYHQIIPANIFVLSNVVLFKQKSLQQTSKARPTSPQSPLDAVAVLYPRERTKSSCPSAPPTFFCPYTSL